MVVVASRQLVTSSWNPRDYFFHLQQPPVFAHFASLQKSVIGSKTVNLCTYTEDESGHSEIRRKINMANVKVTCHTVTCHQQAVGLTNFSKLGFNSSVAKTVSMQLDH